LVRLGREREREGWKSVRERRLKEKESEGGRGKVLGRGFWGERKGEWGERGRKRGREEEREECVRERERKEGGKEK